MFVYSSDWTTWLRGFATNQEGGLFNSTNICYKRYCNPILFSLRCCSNHFLQICFPRPNPGNVSNTDNVFSKPHMYIYCINPDQDKNYKMYYSRNNI